MNSIQPPREIVECLALYATGDVIDMSRTEEIPRDPGAYLLLFQIARAIPFSTTGAKPLLVQPNWYVYAGSARGPGGMRARLRRHFRRDKRKHWHIDQLTVRTDLRLWALTAPEHDECELVARLLATGNFTCPCPGFGSSDCGRCEAHLLAWAS